MTRAADSEHREQVAIISWCREMVGIYPDLRHIRGHAIDTGWTSAYRGNFMQWNTAHARGVVAGDPDLHLPVARGGFFGLYIELKRTRDPDTNKDRHFFSEEQIARIQELRNLGHLALGAIGAGEAIAILETYVNLPRTEVQGGAAITVFAEWWNLPAPKSKRRRGQKTARSSDGRGRKKRR